MRFIDVSCAGWEIAPLSRHIEAHGVEERGFPLREPIPYIAHLTAAVYATFAPIPHASITATSEVFVTTVVLHTYNYVKIGVI